jgi:hypothetical protein
MKVNERVYIDAKSDGRGGWLAMTSPTAITVQRAGTVIAVTKAKGTVTVRFDDCGLVADMKAGFVHTLCAPDRIAGLKREVLAEVKALGELAEAGIRVSDFPRYDAQQQRVSDAKKSLRKAMGIVDPKPVESDYCAFCRRSVDRDVDALEIFADGTLLHRHCAEDLRANHELTETGTEN